jgi:hypothetical protein
MGKATTAVSTSGIRWRHLSYHLSWRAFCVIAGDTRLRFIQSAVKVIKASVAENMS